jgi:acyl-ACP thioesterase
MAMVEAAAHHADALGFGFDKMLANDMTWILSRLKIRFYDFPRLDDKVTIQTWPKGFQQKIFFMRDYHLMGSSGQTYASATSAYILVNPRLRRMLPPQALTGDLPDNGGLSALDEVLDKIPIANPPQEQLTMRAGYSAIDLMGHVNNARYIDWISDCFSFDEHQKHKMSWLQVNYINEVKPGESVSLQRAGYTDQPNTWYIAGANMNTEAKAFEAQVGWENDHGTH